MPSWQAPTDLPKLRAKISFSNQASRIPGSAARLRLGIVKCCSMAGIYPNSPAWGNWQPNGPWNRLFWFESRRRNFPIYQDLAPDPPPAWPCNGVIVIHVSSGVTLPQAFEVARGACKICGVACRAVLAGMWPA